MACLLTVGCRLARLLSDSDNILPDLEKKKILYSDTSCRDLGLMTGVGNYYLAITL